MNVSVPSLLSFADIGSKLIRCSLGKGSFQKIEKCRDACTKQPSRWIKRPQGDLGCVDLAPLDERPIGKVVTYQCDPEMIEHVIADEPER